MAKKYNARGLLENAKANMDAIEEALAKKLDTEVSSKRYDNKINSTNTTLIKNTWKDLVKGCAKDAVKVVKALYGSDSKNKLLKEVFGNSILKSATKAQLKSGFNKILNSTSQGKKVVSASSQYEKLVGLYASLENVAKKGKNIDSISSSFVKACNKLEKSLGLATSTLSDGTQLTYNKNQTVVTVPNYYGNTLKSNAYKSTVKTIDASGRTNAIQIIGNAKANVIYGGSGKNTISGGNGNDNIKGNKSNDLLKGDAGADVIYGGAGKDTLYGGDGNDKLYGEIGNDTLYGGNGHDTLQGGVGNDVLTGNAGKDIFWYKNGDGKDTIMDYTSGQDKIRLGSGSISKVTLKNKDTIFTIGKGSITAKNTKGKKITVVDAKGKSTTYLNGKRVSSDNGSVANVNGVKAVLAANSSGNFKLEDYNKTAKTKAVNIDASACLNNSISLYGDDRANVIWSANGQSNYYRYIYAGKGNDIIYCGTGHDRIYYYYGDGNETVYNFTSNDYILLQSSDAQFKNVAFSGNDVILNLTSGNTITLKNAKDQKINVLSHYGYSSSYTLGRFTSLTSKQLVLSSDYEGPVVDVKTYALNPQNIDASACVSYDIWLYGDDRANVIKSANGQSNYYRRIYAGKGNDIIYCGTGRDHIYYYYGDGNETVYNFTSNDTIHLSNIYPEFKNVAFSGNDVILNLTSGNTITLKNAKDQKINIDAYWWDNDYDRTFGRFTSLTSKQVVLSSDYEGTFDVKTYALNPQNIDASACINESISLYGDDRANVIKSANGPSNYDRKIYAGKGNDIIYCGTGRDHIYYYYGDGNETVYNFTSSDTIRLWDSDVEFKNVAFTGNDVILNLTSGNTITLKNAKNQEIDISSDWANNSYDGTFGRFTSLTSKQVVLSADYKGTCDVKTYALNPQNIDASACINESTIWLYGDDRANVIKSANGQSNYYRHIYAGKGNDIIYCGTGRDHIHYLYGDGNETVYNYTSNDPIVLQSRDALFKNVAFSGNDVILNLTSGNTITLKNAKDQEIDVSSWFGSSYDRAFGRFTSLTSKQVVLSSDYEGTFDVKTYALNPQNIDASACINESISLYGDDRANVIKSANGPSNYDRKIYAGKGNDIIYGGTGRDHIYYNEGDGNETIYDIDVNDRIHFNNCAVTSKTTNGSDVILNVGSGTVTLKGIASSGFSYTDTTGSYTNVVLSDSFVTENSVSSPASMKMASSQVTSPYIAEDDMQVSMLSTQESTPWYLNDETSTNYVSSDHADVDAVLQHKEPLNSMQSTPSFGVLSSDIASYGSAINGNLMISANNANHDNVTAESQNLDVGTN